jgi:hypothetical protein
MADQREQRAAEHHQLPWRVEPKVGTRGRTVLIVNCDGGLICECDYPDRAKHIVECVNYASAKK